MFFLFVGGAAAQDFDARLLEGFSMEELKTMQSENPEELKLMTAFADHGFLLMDYPKQKKGALDPSTAIEIKEMSSFNPLAYGFRPHDHARIYYPIVGMPGKMMAILPITELK